MAKFKPGMKAYDPRFGVVTLRDTNDVTPEVLVDLLKEGKVNMSSDQYHRYFEDGRLHRDHENPTLLTLEEAEKMGYEIPKQPFTIESDVRWVLGEDREGNVAIFPEGGIQHKQLALRGMCGKLTFVESD